MYGHTWPPGSLFEGRVYLSCREFFPVGSGRRQIQERLGWADEESRRIGAVGGPFCVLGTSPSGVRPVRFSLSSLMYFAIVMDNLIPFEVPYSSTLFWAFVKIILSNYYIWAFLFYVGILGIIKRLFFIDVFEFWKVVTLRYTFSYWLTSGLMEWKKMRYKSTVIHQLQNNTCRCYVWIKLQMKLNDFF